MHYKNKYNYISEINTLDPESSKMHFFVITNTLTNNISSKKNNKSSISNLKKNKNIEIFIKIQLFRLINIINK